MKIKWKSLIVSVLIPLLTGGLAALITGESFSSFENVQKPPLTPPAWLFPVVWSILYVLMGIASYLVLLAEDTGDEKINAFIFYALQLVFNFFWPILFFGFAAYFISFVWIILLLALVLITAVKFYKLSKPAGLLLLPYILWVSFATYLNYTVFILNR